MPTFQLDLIDYTVHHANCRSRKQLDAWLETVGLQRWLANEPSRLLGPNRPVGTATEQLYQDAVVWKITCVRNLAAKDNGAALIGAVLGILADIETAGGLTADGDGLVADPEWPDLADSYRALCAALKLKPVISH